MSPDACGPVGLGARLRSPWVRTTALTAALAAVTAVGFVALRGHSHLHPAPDFQFAWWAVAIGFLASELNVFHLELNRETHSFSLSEVPLTVAFFFAAPIATLTGRLVSKALVILAKEHQSP